MFDPYNYVLHFRKFNKLAVRSYLGPTVCKGYQLATKFISSLEKVVLIFELIQYKMWKSPLFCNNM